MEDCEEIIKRAGKMKEMLNSVYSYNSGFILSEKDKNFLCRILFAMSVIDRKYYCEEGVYIDTALPIGESQTISQPSTVARMIFLSKLEEGDDILEVGTGSGWNASLLAFLSHPGNVLSIEKFESLVKKAERNISKLRSYLKQKKPETFQKIGKMNFFAENIFEKKMAWKKKYNRIIITAGIKTGEEKKIEDIARALLKQNGRLICPYMQGPILIYEKKGRLESYKTKEEYVFVPLTE